MEIKLSNLKVFKAKEGKNYTSVILQSGDDQIAFGVKNTEAIAGQLIKSKGGIIDFVFDLQQMNNGNCFIVPVSASTNGK